MAILAPQGPFRAFDQNGQPLANGKLYTYEAGTSTPKVTYTDASEVTPNTNPIILDSEGYANVWLESGSYKFVLDDSNDVNQWAEDDVAGSSTGVFGASVTEQDASFNLTSVFENNLIVATESITISLLPASVAEEGFIFSVQNSSDGDVTIDPDGSETINGSATIVIPSGGGGTIVCDGSNWQVISLVNVTNDGDNVFTGDNEFTGKTKLPDAGELTISTGEVTVTGGYHTIDTESDASSDDLTTISGGSDGQVLIIRQADDARVVTITDTGNIVLPSDVDISLLDTKDVVTLIYDGEKSKWVIMSAPTPSATETVKGVIEIATTSEAQDATDTVKAITPENLGNTVLGIGQTWQNVTRAHSVAYQNTTGRPIQLAIVAAGGDDRIQASVDASTWVDVGQTGSDRNICSNPVIPNNWYYRMNGSNTIEFWTELR